MIGFSLVYVYLSNEASVILPFGIESSCCLKHGVRYCLMFNQLYQSTELSIYKRGELNIKAIQFPFNRNVKDDQLWKMCIEMEIIYFNLMIWSILDINMSIPILHIWYFRLVFQDILKEKNNNPEIKGYFNWSPLKIF